MRLMPGVMLALVPHPEDAAALAEAARSKYGEDSAEAASDLHITLAYYGETEDLDRWREYSDSDPIEALQRLAKALSKMWISEVTISGLTRFYTKDDKGSPVVALVNSWAVCEMRRLVERDMYAPYPRTNYEYTPHLTLAYVPEDKAISVSGNDARTVRIKAVRLAVGGQYTDYELPDASMYEISTYEPPRPVGWKPIKLSILRDEAEALPSSCFLLNESGQRSLLYKDADDVVIPEWAHNARVLAEAMNLDKSIIKELPQIEKAGKRMQGSMLSRLQDGVKLLQDLLKWGSYEDGKGDMPEDMDEEDMQGMMKSFGVQLDPKSPPQFLVFKDKKGTDRWISFSSNSFRDREGEIISAKAIDGAIDYNDGVQDWGPLRIFHLEAVDVGKCDFQGVAGRFLVESGTIDDTPMGKQFLEFCSKAHPPLGTSIGFMANMDAFDPVHKAYDEIRIYERSVLPLEYAANPYTAFSVITEKEKAKMDKRKLDFLRDVFDEKTVESIVTSAESRTRDLEATVAFKEVTEPEPVLVEGDKMDEDRIKALVRGLSPNQPIDAEVIKDLHIAAGMDPPKDPEPDPQAEMAKAISNAVGEHLKSFGAELGGVLKGITDRLDVIETRTKEAPEPQDATRASRVFRASDGASVTEEILKAAGIPVPDLDPGRSAHPAVKYIDALAVSHGGGRDN